MIHLDARGADRASAIAQAAAFLANGGLVAFPTESFYGIAARIDDAGALRRLAAAKGRDGRKPVALVAADAEAATRLWSIPTAARADIARLAERFWPGPLTLVFPPTPDAAALLVGPAGVGVRVAIHPVARALAHAAGGLITATSCNPGGEAAPTSVEGFAPELVQQLDAVLDGGVTAGGAPSTVLSWHDGIFSIERAGAIGTATLRAALGDALAEDETPPSTSGGRLRGGRMR